MNLRRLKKEFGEGVQVQRGRRGVVIATAAGLEYRAQEHRFGTERALADYVKSKMPVATIRAPINGG